MRRNIELRDSGIKQINFIVNEGVRLHLKPFSVDLSVLDGVALLLTNLISTTENRDDLSHVYIQATNTYRELYFLEGKSEAVLEDLENLHGFDFLDKKALVVWKWDSLRKSESPEEFFIRHADRISKIEGIIIGSSRYDVDSEICS